MTPYTAPDGRIFTFDSEVDHTTRDQRQIRLYVWVGRCSIENCPNTVTSKTVPTETINPKYFKPPKHCTAHRTHANIVRARREGLDRWRNDKEAQALAAQRRADRIWTAERYVYEAAQAFALVGDVTLAEVIALAAENMPAPTEGKRDTRHYRAQRAWLSLFLKKRLRVLGGFVVVLR